MKRTGLIALAVLFTCSASAEVWEARYGVAETFNFKLYNADGTLDTDEADAGTEVTLSCAEGAETTATNDFVDEGTFYSIALTAAELQCERVAVVIAATTTEVFFIQTVGHASAMTPTTGWETGDSFARIGAAGAGLTAIDLPNQTMSITGNITGNLSGSVGSVTGAVGSVTGTIGGLTAAALADFFDTDSGTTYASAVSGSVVEEIADNAGGSALTVAGINAGAGIHTTTIATLASQTSFTLTAGSGDDDAYNGYGIVIVDASTATQQALGIVDDYTGSTKTITLQADPGVFTMAASDNVQLLPAFLTTGVDVTTIEGTDATDQLDSHAAAGATAAEIVNEWESQSQADPTGFHVNVLEIGGTSQTANDNGADINAILVDTGTDGVQIPAGEINAAAIANGAIDAATFASDVDAEILSYVVDDATRIDASEVNGLSEAIAAVPTAAENVTAIEASSAIPIAKYTNADGDVCTFVISESEPHMDVSCTEAE